MDLQRKGSELKALKDNPFFISVMEEIREELVNAEDAIINKVGLTDDEMFKAMFRIAVQRTLLTEIVNKMDQAILLAKNEGE